MKESTFKKYCLVVDEYFVNGFNGRKAYQKYYKDCADETADVNFSKILSITKVSEYKEQKAKNKSEELNITLLSQLKRLDSIIDTAEKESDKINAIKEQNKLLALYKEHNKQKEVNIPISKGIDLSNATPEQIKLLGNLTGITDKDTE